MGYSHMASGAAAGAGVMAVVHPARASTVAVFVGLTAVSALLPDLDHPGSRLSRWLGPVGWLVARVLGGCQPGRFTCWVLSRCGRGGVVAYRLLDRGVAGGHRGLTHSLLGLGLAVASSIPVAASTSVAWWHAVAVVLGCAVHIAGDAITEYGVPLLWPNPRRYRIGTLNTGSWVETLVLCPLFIIAAGVGSYAAVTVA